MMHNQHIKDPKKIARLAGFLYVLLVPLGVFGILYVPNALIVSGDAATTISNILSNENMYRLSIVSALLTQIVNLFVVVYLYILLKPVNKNHAAMMLIFILVAVPIAMFNELNRIAVLFLLNDSITLARDQVHSLVTLLLDIHQQCIHLVGIFWGLWLLPMGYLVYQSNFIPKFIGIFLIIGGIAYVIDFFTALLFPNFTLFASDYTFLGEVLMMLWLLIKGIDEKQWNKTAHELSNH
ncbi:MAG: DUF4386 domain-containing protein [Gammaproteobacteria bacterium]|nr:DUF4386 domain-containing protein [Gammaproteobacteria bacterium]